MPSKNKRVLPSRALSWNVLSGNVSSPAIMRIPLVTNTVRLPLVTGGVPFSMNRGVMPRLKHIGRKQARYEADVESMLRDELLKNEMGYESGEISEEVFRKRKADLTKRLEELEKKGS